MYHIGNGYWKQYAESDFIPLDKKYKDYTQEERNICCMGQRKKGRNLKNFFPFFFYITTKSQKIQDYPSVCSSSIIGKRYCKTE